MILLALTLSLAQGAPVTWDEVTLRLDVRNLTGPSDAGKLTWEQMTAKLEEVNRIWSTCQIRFVSRSASNVAAASLQIPYEPQSQGDLHKIARALNPNGFNGAIPLTIAGPWNFFDHETGVWLHGLGWAFYRPADKQVVYIGAMIGAQRLNEKRGGVTCLLYTSPSPRD